MESSEVKVDGDRKGLPPRPRPRPLHKRTWSGGMNLTKVENMLQSFTPPILTRKRAPTMEEEREQFHNRNQQFLQSVQHTRKPSLDSIPIRQTGSFRDSPRRKSSLQSIGDDDWEKGDEEDSIGGSYISNSNRIEGMDLLNDESSQFSGSYDEFRDESTAETPHYQRQIRSEFGQKLDLDRQQRDKQRKEDMARRLSNVLDRGTSETPREAQEFLKEYVKELESERETLIRQWKDEFEAENRSRVPPPAPSTNAPLETKTFSDKYVKPCRQYIFHALATLELFICNMPLTIAASALSWVTLGVVWFKFTAEHLTMYGYCKPVHFYNSQNTYRHEFPGSFSCEQVPLYKTALYFHFACSIFAALLASFFLAKVIFAWKVVSDDLTNPVTATPVGVICITLEVLFAATGKIGGVGVLTVAVFHSLFAFWFLYVAVIKFKLLPDPSWFPGMVGLAYAAVKSWLYCNIAGKVFLGMCLAFFFGTFFISVIRVALNKKIAAPVCWIQLSAPSIALYAATIMSQPTLEEEMQIESSPRASYLYRVQMQDYYLPFQHLMMVLTMLGAVSAVHSLWTRWDVLKQKEFSPAHLAFCFPTLSHTNSIQAYRAAVNSFSTIPKSSYFHLALYGYWVFCLVAGTIVNLIFTYKALIRLPKWTQISVAGEEEPPEPADTIMAEMLHDAHEIFDQPFVSPAVLQANEAGTLIRVRRGTEDYRRHGPYVRTRHVASLGFDMTLSAEELREERSRLLDWVAKNAPRTRNRTLSIPMMLKLKDNNGRGLYGSFDDAEPSNRHRRSQTMSDVV